jgi:preprotein translocase subunit SecF
MEMNTKTAHDYGRFDFVGKAGIFGGISIAFVVISLIILAVKGVTYGIDFAGGTEMQVKFAQPVSIDHVRAVAEKQGLLNVGLQALGNESEYVIRFQTPHGATDKEANEMQTEGVNKLRQAITTELASGQPDIRRVDSVGPQVGAELKRNGFLAVFYCLLVILIYVGLRFDYNYAPGAVLCLAHDAIITLAIFVITGREVNVAILASILTLMGYSLNDTIVVFDRIRETDHMMHDRGTRFVINKAINDMFERTLITSGTVFASALSLYCFAGGTVSDIAFAMCIGIIFGTYSSIYVAAPSMLVMEKLRSNRKAVTA